MRRSPLLSTLRLAEGDRVILDADYGEEPKGVIVDLVVEAYRVRFDDGVVCDIAADDRDLKPAAEER